MGSPVRSLELITKAADIWPVDISMPKVVSAQLLPLLAPEETASAKRFRFDHLRDSFVLSRGLLSVLLGLYLNISPHTIEFSYGPTRKPSVARSRGVKFNLSHSGGLALFAFTSDCEIGIDVEQIHPLEGIDDIASRFFCPEETAQVLALRTEKHSGLFSLLDSQGSLHQSGRRGSVRTAQSFSGNTAGRRACSLNSHRERHECFEDVDAA
jgi:4'-phosphopantetheinyl transferase